VGATGFCGRWVEKSDWGVRLKSDLQKRNCRIKRLFDLMLAVLTGCILLLLVLVVAALVRLTSKGPALYWSDRVGRINTIFKMPKFHSMRVGTPAVATQPALNNPKISHP
jgi:lipopolysaccharide/colanic/teichoic acid biosynthesis glycosyltransferase